MGRFIVLMTDFGLKDPYVGMMKGVISSINPNAVVIDLTHDVPKYNVVLASHILKVSYRYFPKGSIFTVVIDPGVGTSRRALIIRSRNYYFVGPDNGVLLPAALSDGFVSAYEINTSLAGLKEISHTFHGRDVFAPTAAYLSLGIEPESLSYRVLSTEELVRVSELPEEPRVEGRYAVLKVIHIDDFGNLILNTDLLRLSKYLGISYGSAVEVLTNNLSVRARVVRTFAEVKPGDWALYEGSYRLAEIARYLGSASRDLGVSVGSEVRIRAAN